MRCNPKRRGISSIVGTMIMLAIVTTLGVVSFTYASGAMSNLSADYASAMSNGAGAANEKFAVEQVAFTVPGTMPIDGTSTRQVVGSSTSIATTLTTTRSSDVVIAYVSPADTGTTAPPSVSGISGGGLSWTHRVTTSTETYTYSYVPVTLTNNVGGAMTLDGKNYNTQTTPTQTISASISTANPNDVIVAIAYGQSASGVYTTPSVSDSVGLAWQPRGALQEVSDSWESGNYQGISAQIFYAIAPTAVSDTITLTWSSAPTGYSIIQVFGVSGANIASPFDTHSGLPAFVAGAYASVTTSNPNDFVFGFENTDTTAAPTIGSGFTAITSGVSNSYFCAEYKVVSAVQNPLSMTYSNAASDSNGAFGDAIQAAPAASTPNPFQQKITWNPSTYATYEASDLGNIRFCADTACHSPLYAWLESCSPSCGTSATSATAWVLLTSSIASGGGTLTIYIVFTPTSTDFDGVYWGEAPELSATYGQHDNGANVFTQYGGKSWNSFTLVEGIWSTANGYLQQTATTGGGNGGPAALIEGTSYPASGAYVLDTAFQYTVQATPRVGLVAVQGLNAGDPEGYRFIGQQNNNGPGFLSFINDPATWVVNNVYSGSTSTSYTMEVVDSAGTWSGTLFSGYGTTGTSLTALAATAYSANNNEGSATGYVGLSAGYYSTTTSNVVPNPATFQWFAMRALPPSDVMPATSLGSTSSASITFDTEEWYAIASSPLSSVLVTASLSSPGDTAATWIAVYGVSGASIATPFDTSSSVPQSVAGTSPSTTMSTSNQNDMLLYACAAGLGGVPSGFTSIYSNSFAPSQNEYVGYEVVSATQTNLVTSCGSNSYGTEITDAVEASPTGGADVYVRNTGSIPTTLVSVYVFDQSTGVPVSQFTISTTVNVGSFVDIPRTTLVFAPSHGQTYMFTVASSMGNRVVYSQEAT